MSRCPCSGVQPAQEGKRVQTGGVAALERDLQGVLADQADVLDPQLSWIQVLDSGEATWSTRLAATLGAGTGPSELLPAVHASMAAFPFDHHLLALAVDV